MYNITSYVTGDIIPLSLLVILPGFLSYAFGHYIIDKRINDSTYSLTLKSLFLSLINYFVVYLILLVFNDNINTAWFTLKNIQGNEIILILIIILNILILGIIVSFCLYRDITKILRTIITKKDYDKGFGDVWDEIITNEKQYVIVETKDNNQYLGYIESAGYRDEKREIYLCGNEASIRFSHSGKSRVDLDEYMNCKIDGILLIEDDIKRLYVLKKKK